MKEHFEDRKLTGQIHVKLKKYEGKERQERIFSITKQSGEFIWNTDKELLTNYLISIVEKYYDNGDMLSLRQLYYQLVKRNLIPNHDTVYKKISSLKDDCAYSGMLNWAAIEDRGRRPYLQYYVEDIAHAMKDTIDSYKIDRQRDQNTHIEVWIEKDALSAIFARVTNKYHVRLVVNKGYTSSSAIYDAYQRFSEIINEDKKIIILYFGDHDPSGLDMIRDIKERLSLMFIKGKNNFDEPYCANWCDGNSLAYPFLEGEQYIEEFIKNHFKIIPIGLSMEQINKYKLPPNPAKISDPRAVNYIKRYGNVSWEVDALDPPIIRQIVTENIEKRIDVKLFKEMCSLESKQRKELDIMNKSFHNFNDSELWGDWTCPKCQHINSDPENIGTTQCGKCESSVILTPVVEGKRRAVLIEE